MIASAGLFAPRPHVLPTVVHDQSLPGVEIGGVRLHAKAYGPLDADKLVIALHGGPGNDYRALLPLMPLATDDRPGDMRVRLVFYDQRGAGLSQRVGADLLSVAHYVAELDAVIDYFATEMVAAATAADGGVAAWPEVHLLGHSWGAMLAAAYAGRHPDRPASIILVEPGFLTEAASAPFLAAVSSPKVSFGLVGHVVWSLARSVFVTSTVAADLGPGDDDGYGNGEGQRPRVVRDPDAYLDWLVGAIAMEAPGSDAPLSAYFCGNTTATAHLPWWRFGSAASLAIQSYVSATGETIDARLDVGLGDYAGAVLIVAGECNTLIGPAHQAKYHLDLFQNARMVVREVDTPTWWLGRAVRWSLPLLSTCLVICIALLSSPPFPLYLLSVFPKTVANAGHTLIGEAPEEALAIFRDHLWS